MAVRILIVAMCVSLGGLYARDLSSQRSFVTQMPSFTRLPATLDGWYSEDYSMSENVAAVLDADATLQRRYRHPNGSEVGLFLAYFAEQQVNSQIHSPRHCVPGGGWNVVSLQQETVQLAHGSEAVTCMNLERGGAEQQILYWFRTQSGIVTGEYALKWDLVCNSLRRRPSNALFVRYTATRENTEAMHKLMAGLDPLLSDIVSEVGLE